MEEYLGVAAEVVRRRRRLNALRGMRLGATSALGAIFLYLIAVYLGLVGMIEPWWLIFPVIFAVYLGGRMGWKQPVSLQEDLYRVDRAFGLGEALSTIYELRRYGMGQEFLTALYRRIEGLSIDVRRALTLSVGERRGWIGLGGLAVGSLILIGLWLSGIPPLPPGWWALPHLPETATSDSADIVSRTDPQPQPAEEPVSAGEVTQRASQPQKASNIRQNLHKGTEVRGVEYAPEADPGTANPTSGLGEGSPALSRALTELQRSLESGELSPAQAREQLKRLAEQAPEGLREVLQRAVSAGDTESMQRRLDEAASKFRSHQQDEGHAPEEGQGSQSQAESSGGASSASQAGSSGKDGGFDEDEQPPGEPTDTEAAEADGEQGEQARSSAEQQAGENDASAPNAEASPGGAGEGTGSQSMEAEANGDKSASERGQEARSGGDGVGLAPGRAAEASSNSEIQPVQDLLIQGGDLPADLKLLDQLLTRGLPVDLLGSDPEGKPILRLDIARVETLLELRDLPPELRSLVRAYFLALAKEP